MRPRRFNSTLTLPLLLIGFALVIAYGLVGDDGGALPRALLAFGIVFGISGALIERRETPRK